jgi:L-fuconolactonase
MLRIDAHIHFWNFDPARDKWITEDMSEIRRNFSPADAIFVLFKKKFSGCIAVQADQSEQETLFLLSLAERFSMIKGIVGWVDLQSDKIQERLYHFSQFKEIKGFRHILQGEKDRALMITPSFMKGIAFLKKYGFTYDILVYPDQLKYVHQFVKSFPEQPFIIDHIAKPYIKKQLIDEWKKDMFSLASFPNVYCKISGMVTEADWQNWKKEDIFPYLDVVTEAFGTDRLVYGSDWPVCLVAASYEKVYELVNIYYSDFSMTEKQKIFGGNAVKFYNIK